MIFRVSVYDLVFIIYCDHLACFMKSRVLFVCFFPSSDSRLFQGMEADIMNSCTCLSLEETRVEP